MPSLIETLAERGFIEACTSDELKDILAQPTKVYCGFDPTADSLHLGHLICMMGLAWFQRFGHTPFVILGGATGMIGDPSGKISERQILDEETLLKNLIGIHKNFEKILEAHGRPNATVFLNNYDWFKNFSLVSFLRQVGKYFRMGPMLSKDSVKGRMTSEEGMSFTEFAYQVLQGYDFLHLFQNYGVKVQIGGSDQWGNITAGTELIRKAVGQSSYGLTFPLLTRSDGQKFGKSEKGAIWLSADKLSPYEFYQYLVRVSDADVIKMMRMLTFMDMDEIRKYQEQMQQPDYVPNTAQKRLAKEVTRIVHGEENFKIALGVTEAAAPGAKANLDAPALELMAQNMPSRILKNNTVVNAKLLELICQVGLLPSKSEARRLARNGGIYLNNNKVEDEHYTIRPDDLIANRLLLLAVGKKNKILISIEN
ncbi:tyrosine--tRNA ligase [Neochlamydia sp. AcF95]|uniref:tyrosine--tRNA ligase n=1 Tax=Neochlamydia sp. AcF95 TaxID=2795734 RepID=UPI001BC97C5E|nr:tyrosine--tRNA ligase [Neochlamydia sp. AcF95]MBS4171533.1 Tyrosine--tRNA ligase [Neochlamydia sp. AcF95]